MRVLRLSYSDGIAAFVEVGTRPYPEGGRRKNVCFRPIADIALEAVVCRSMRYDLEMLGGYCREIGLDARFSNEMSLEVDLGRGATLCFQNAQREEDCLIGFLDTPWHFHGDVMFADRLGHSVEFDQLSLLKGLWAGEVLVCEQHKGGKVVDRWLTHSHYNDELGHVAPDENMCFRRASSD